jgi:ABC-type phosphate transport system permease subunit
METFVRVAFYRRKRMAANRRRIKPNLLISGYLSMSIDYQTPPFLRVNHDMRQVPTRIGHPMSGLISCGFSALSLALWLALFIRLRLIYAAHPGQDADGIGPAAFSGQIPMALVLIVLAIPTGILAAVALLQTTQSKVTGLLGLTLSGGLLLGFISVIPG